MPRRNRGPHTIAEFYAELALASQIGAKLQQARAHHGLARAHQAAADPSRARQHWQRALALYTDLGVPEAGQVRAELATANHDDQPEP